jgi:hypothetical protein
MTFQLRRMVLVNAGTNKHKASGRITEIDPRGGAAVIGENAVGKTFTLRLIPLFFGHPARELVAVDKGQEGASFIFPSPTSAVCFEYQRGSDRPEDLRLVVLRARADGKDAPEYRIFPCGFDKSLFIEEGRFLNDEGSEAAARAKGLAPTKKLTTSEYRSVILRTGYSGQDAGKLRGYGLAHSFGPKSLPNLDKLVATMVKKSIRFDELVAVAVGLVQDDMAIEARKGELVLRQQKGDLQRWMRNLDAARRADKLAPTVTQLQGQLLDLSTAETEWRQRHHDVHVLIAQRAKALDVLKAEMTLAEQDRENAAKQEGEQIERCAGAARAAATHSTTASQTFASAQSESQHFKDERAAHWEQELARIEPLKHERDSLVTQLQVAQAQASTANIAHSQAVAGLEKAAAESVAKLELKKAEPRSQFERDSDAAERSHQSALRDMETEIAAQEDEAATQQADLANRAAGLKAQVERPAVDKALEDAVTQTNDMLLRLSHEASSAGEAQAYASRVAGDAQRAFDDAEKRLITLKERVQAAEEALKVAKLRLAPATGTLLSALRSHPDESWKQSLARVIDPSLLDRTDLQPTFDSAQTLSAGDGPDEGQTLYGWQLQVGHLSLPAWADDGAVREAVMAADAAVGAAKQAQSAHQVAMQDLSVKMTEANRIHAAAQSEVSVVHRRRGSLTASLDQAVAAVEQAKNGASEKAAIELAMVKVALSDLQKQITSIRASRAQRTRDLLAQKDEQLKQARLRREEALETLDLNIGAINTQRDEQLDQLSVQLGQQLTAQGVDVKALASLQTRVAAIDGQLKELSDRAALVKSYKSWLVADGPNQLVDLERAAQQAAAAAEVSTRALEAARKVAAKAQQDFDDRMSAQRARATDLDKEVAKLEPLLELFDGYSVMKHDRVDLTSTAEQLRQTVHQEAKSLRAAHTTLNTLFVECRRQLTLTESTVKDLVESKLAGQEGDTVLAQCLIEAYRNIEHQVVGDLNNSLGTILNHIVEFRRRIMTFEKGVTGFNKQLQEALQAITHFDRLEDFKINIVADFADLEFYAKLSRMDEVLRSHQTGRGEMANSPLPSDETVEALRDFMSVLGSEGLLKVDLSQHIRLHGSVLDNGTYRGFKNSQQFENASSNGLGTAMLITLLVGLVNVIRRGEKVFVPWVTDEVGVFDASTFSTLMNMLRTNRIDVITASPGLEPHQMAHFSQRYMFLDRGEICRYLSDDIPEDMADEMHQTGGLAVPGSSPTAEVAA